MLVPVIHAELFILNVRRGQELFCKLCKVNGKDSNKLNIFKAAAMIIDGCRLLRYVQHVHGREATAEELLLAHKATHVQNYCPEHGTTKYPLDSPDLAESDPTPNIQQSSTSLLSKPSSLSPKDTPIRCAREAEAGEAVKDDAEQLQEEQRRLQNAAATEPAEADTASPMTPSGFKSRMSCGQLGIGML